MAEEYDLPVVAGGDRHGCRPNTVLNVTKAESWADFVAEIRGDRRSDVLILPAYEEPLGLRQLEVVADALRRYPEYPYGQRRFTNRTFADVDGYSWHPLSFYWDGGVPLWLRPILSALVALGSSRARSILRLILFWRREKDLIALPLHADEYAVAASLQNGGVPK